jgi:hypothetical protein
LLHPSAGACVDKHKPIARIHGQHIHLERRFVRGLEVRRKTASRSAFGASGQTTSAGKASVPSLTTVSWNCPRLNR